ncbi:MAG: hypothetical protein F6K55_20290 [Moorea sp. SIO4A3]|nr:hypothetical protein [Moorena sp. SIO4A3]
MNRKSVGNIPLCIHRINIIVRGWKRCSKGTGEAARSWEGSAVLGVPPTRYCRGFHGANSGADAGSAHSPSPLALCIKN